MGKIFDYLEKDWGNMWSEDNSADTITKLSTGLLGGFGAYEAASQIKDTEGIEAAMQSLGNTQFGTGSFDNLMNNFSVNNFNKTNYTKEDLLAYTPEQQWLNAGIAGLSGFLGTPTNTFATGGLITAGINALSGLIGSGLGSWRANVKAKEEAARLNNIAKETNQMYLNNFNNAVSNTQNTMFNKSLLNIASYGGPLFDLGGEFNNGLTFIDEGGLHSENPFGGVMVGIDQEGTPNLVEEGEIIYNDYVFSNRLKPTKKQLADSGFTDKYNDWTFAKIVEDLQKESSERPNDIISKKGLDDMMGRMITMQEEIRNKTDNKTKQVNQFPDGGWASNLRYLSPVLHGIGLINNLQSPDFSAEKTLINRASNIPGGSFTPLGDYLNLQEVDSNRLVNPILANAAANRRAIQNQSLDPRASLLANNYSVNNAIGESLIQGTQANNQIKSTEAQFNRGTNQANAQMGLQALAMDQQKAQQELNILANALNSMKQTEALRSSAIGAEMGALGEEFGLIGKEAIDRTNYDKLIEKGYIPKGWTTTSARGGFLTRKKK